MTGTQATSVQKSVREMHGETGMPLEGSELPPFFEDFDFCAGLSDNNIEPHNLEQVVGVKKVEKLLREMILRTSLERKLGHDDAADRHELLSFVLALNLFQIFVFGMSMCVAQHERVRLSNVLLRQSDGIPHSDRNVCQHTHGIVLTRSEVQRCLIPLQVYCLPLSLPMKIPFNTVSRAAHDMQRFPSRTKEYAVNQPIPLAYPEHLTRRARQTQSCSQEACLEARDSVSCRVVCRRAAFAGGAGAASSLPAAN